MLTTYGRSSGFCVDPIEKKPLNHFLPGTAVLSFGTAGCNLTCLFCQNWSISKSGEMDTLADPASPEGDSTYCHQCGRRVIGRDHYVLTGWGITEGGEFRFCGTRCAGVFAGQPGDWGARSLPVRLGGPVAR